MRISHGTYRGVIALVAVVGAFALGLGRLILVGDGEIPTWTGTLVGAIVAFYFGERAAVVASRNGANSPAQPSAAEHETDKQ